MRMTNQKGFNLTELLIGLGVLGVIAAVAVPKVLNASTAAVANAKVHKAAQAVANGVQKWTEQNGQSGFTTPADIMTFVQHNGRITNNSRMDWVPNTGQDYTCRASTTPTGTQANCYRMPDGAVIYFLGNLGAGNNFNTFGGNGFNGLYFGVDPDGITTADNSNDNTSAATAFIVYGNGRLRDRGRLKGAGGLQPQWTPTYYRQ
jgi:prepilin-type N-terminal cleavage/methylation domain-containing protein